MKFWHILMFMIIFNMVIIIVNSLHIFNITGYQSASITGEETLKSWAYAIVKGAISGAVLGTFITYLTKVPSDAAAAYSLMSTLYITVASVSLDIISNLAPNEPGMSYVVYLFTGILVFVWAGAMMQMIRGGWRTYE